MLIGVLYVIGACLCWGLVFVVPLFLQGFSSIEIALGRFFFFGLFSFLFLLLKKKHLIQRVYAEAWAKAFLYGFISTLVCYICLVFCMRYANAAVAALIYAMSPITITLFGNYRKQN